MTGPRTLLVLVLLRLSAATEPGPHAAPLHLVQAHSPVDLWALESAIAGVGGASHAHRRLPYLGVLALPLTPATAALLRAHELVAHVELDKEISVDGSYSFSSFLADLDADLGAGLPDPASGPHKKTELFAPWDLDRLDQRSLPLNSLFDYNSKLDGSGVSIFVLDSGVRASHVDFGGRVSPASVNFVDDGQAPSDVSDTNGHGTFVSSLAAGATYGVAKQANIVALRIYGANNSGPLSYALAALEHVAAQLDVSPRRASVVSCSWGGTYSDILNNAVNTVSRAGGVVVVAAGNEAADACAESPASAREALTVAASTSSDAFATFSNFGSCVDLIAPGAACIGASSSSDTGAVEMTGTSMATPLVSGAAAVFLSQFRGASSTEVRAALVCSATTGRVGAPAGTTNALLYVPPGGFPTGGRCAPASATASGAGDSQGTDASARFRLGLLLFAVALRLRFGE